jgi:hypothetical protein
MYIVFFISIVVSSTCFVCYLHPSSGAQLQRTVIGLYGFGVSMKLTVLKCKGVPNQYLLQWNNTPKPYKPMAGRCSCAPDDGCK